MADDMRLLMHPDIGGVISDAAIRDAEQDITIAGSEDGESATGPERFGAGGVGNRRPGPVMGTGAKPPWSSFSKQPIPAGRGLDSTATPPSVSQASEASSSSSASSITKPGASRKRPSPEKKNEKPKFASALAEKHDLLFRMNRMRTRGGKQSRSMNVNDSLEELRCECDRMQREIETEKSVKFQRSLMTSFAAGVECLNARWNFAGLKLDGWSQSLQDDMDSYDEVFEELHEKYATKSSMPPEIKLVMMVLSSAFMFHMSKSMFSTVPGMEEAMRDDPELAKAVAAAVAKKAQTNETTPERKGVAGMFANLMGSGRGSAGNVPPMGAGAVGKPMSPPDNDSVDNVERLFSDDDSESESAHSGAARSRTSAGGSMVLDEDSRGLILDT